MDTLGGDAARHLLASLAYAAMFWVRHLHAAQETRIVQDILVQDGLVDRLLHGQFLEWLECLSLLDQLPQIIEALTTLPKMFYQMAPDSLLALIQDAARFVQRHYSTVSIWPLQIYSSAIIFSPERSIVKRQNLGKVYHWLRKGPRMEVAWGALLQTLTGHSDSVEAVAFSPDRQQIASGSRDKTIKVWDVRTGEVERTLVGHSNVVKAVAFSLDGEWIVSGSQDNSIKVWDVRTGEVEMTLMDHSSSVVAVAFSTDRQQIASGSWDKAIKVWDVRTGEVERVPTGHSRAVWNIALSPNGSHIASGSLDMTIKVWEVRTGEVERTLIGHSDSVRAVVFSTNRERIVSGSEDTTIKVWDVRTGKVERTLTHHSNSVRAVAFSPNESHIASGSSNGTIKVWNASTGEVERTWTDHSSHVLAMAYSLDRERIVSGSMDRTIKIWSLKAEAVERTLALPSHSVLIRQLRFSACGRHVLSNVGCFDITRDVGPNIQESSDPAANAQHLIVRDPWICVGNQPILLLPADMKSTCYDVKGDQLALGFANGRIFNFTIDCNSLQTLNLTQVLVPATARV